MNRLSITIVDLGCGGMYSLHDRARYLRKLMKSFIALRGLKNFRTYLLDHGHLEKEFEKAVMGRDYRERRTAGAIPLTGTEEDSD